LLKPFNKDLNAVMQQPVRRRTYLNRSDKVTVWTQFVWYV